MWRRCQHFISTNAHPAAQTRSGIKRRQKSPVFNAERAHPPSPVCSSAFNRTLHSELGLRLGGAVSAVRRAGVDAGVLLGQVGDLETASSQELHASVAGNKRQKKEFMCDPGKLSATFSDNNTNSTRLISPPSRYRPQLLGLTSGRPHIFILPHLLCHILPTSCMNKRW